MGRFEKKIHKKIQAEQENFDVWFEKHSELLHDFQSNDTEEEVQLNGTKKLKFKKRWLLPIGFLLLLICVALCFLPLLLQSQKPLPQPPAHFGDEAVSNQPLSEQELSALLSENEFLTQFQILTADKTVLKEDNSTVMTILNADLELTDYYITKIQIEYNEYYDFVSKPLYENMERQEVVNGHEVTYELYGTDDSGLFLYSMTSVKEGVKIYWEIHCFEESITEFIDSVLK